MGSYHHNMLRVTGSIIVLGAIARAAPNPMLPKRAALDFFEAGQIVGDEEEMPELPEDVPIPNCTPSAALLKVGNWMYVPNNGQSNTADVWFTMITKRSQYFTAKAACNALDKNIQIASIMNSAENKALKNLHGGSSDKDDAKAWTGGYYQSANNQYYWYYGGKNVNEAMGYTSWNTGDGFPSYDPARYSRTDLRYSSNNWKDGTADDKFRPVVCQMRCKTNYWQ